MRTLTINESVPMTEKQTGLALVLFLSEKDGTKEREEAVLNAMEKDNFFLYMVYKKRMEVLKLPLKLTVTALLFLLMLSDRAGHVTTWIVDCLELQDSLGKEEIDTNDICNHLYPFGFYSEDGLRKRIDEIQLRKGKWDFVY